MRKKPRQERHDRRSSYASKSSTTAPNGLTVMWFIYQAFLFLVFITLWHSV
jgi:hypothetical protein